MALSILDGNQTATTLSTILTSGAHIPAHTVVSLGTQAKSDITSAISGSVVSISNFPSTQTIAGTVTANAYRGQFIKLTTTGELSETYILERVEETSWESLGTDKAYINFDADNQVWVFINANYGSALATNSASTTDSLPPTTGWGNFNHISSLTISYENPLARQVFGTVTIGNFVTIGSLPAISGTVTANLSSVPTHGVTIANTSVTVNGTFYQATQPVSLASLPSLAAGTAQIGSVTASISGTVPVSGTFWQATQPVSGTVTANISGIVPVSISSVTISNFPSTQTVAGTVTAQLNYVAGSAVGLDGGNNDLAGIRLGFNTDTEFSVVANNNGLPIQGTVTANVYSLPKITLIDGSSSVVTADSAIEVFATTTTRSYLLVQVTTGSAYVNVGATATTANGIYLASGQGYAWETTIPQGVCSLISSVTGTAYCAKQA